MTGDTAVVSVDVPVACARCAAGRGCGAGFLAGRDKSRQLTVDIAPDLMLRAGDQVRLSMQPARILQAAILVYGLPLLGLVLTLGLASWLQPSIDDGAAVVYSLLGLLAGVLGGRFMMQRNACMKNLVPVILERVAGPAAVHSANAE